MESGKKESIEKKQSKMGKMVGYLCARKADTGF